MKKGWKIFWIVCAVCLGAGLVCCAISFAMGVSVESIENRFLNGIGWGWGAHRVEEALDEDDDSYDLDDSDDSYDDSDDSYDYDHGGHGRNHHKGAAGSGRQTVIEGSQKMEFSSVSAIDVDVWGGEVYIEKADKGAEKILVETRDVNSRLKLRCYQEGKELILKSARKITGVREGCGEIYIYVPENTRFAEASFNLAAGYLEIEDIRADELSVDVGAGEGNIRYFSAREAEMSCGAGSVTASGTADREMELECGIGEIELSTEGKETDYNYDMECGAGEIQCGEAVYSGLGIDQEIENHAAKEMNISCGMGNVTVHFSEI